MRATASVIFVLAAVLLLGADGPGGAKTPRADEPKTAAKPPMSREEAISRLKAAGFTFWRLPPLPGVAIHGGAGNEALKKAMTLLPLFPDTINLHIGSVTDADLVYIRNLKNLEELGIGGEGVTDRGLQNLNAPKLRRLDLDMTAIDDAALGQIAKIASLQSLSLPQTVTERGLGALKPLKKLTSIERHGGIGDEGLAQLRGMASLGIIEPLAAITDAGLKELDSFGARNRLDLDLEDSPNVTDAGLANVERMEALTSVSLPDTKVTDAGLAHLERLRHLRWLSLAGTKITDAGMAHVQVMTALSRVNLARTQVTDAGVRQIAALPCLQYLDLSETGVTDACLADLEKATFLNRLIFAAPP